MLFLLMVFIPPSCISQLVPLPPATGQSVCIEDGTRQFLAHGQFREAEKDLRRSISTGQPCPEAHFLLGYTLLRLNLPKESLAEYTIAAKLRVPTPADLRNVALDYVLLDDFPDADHWVQRALQIDANDSESWYVLGRIRYSTGRFQDAVDSFKHALAIEPTSLKAENNLGLAYQDLNETDKAIEAYRRAIALGEEAGRPNEQPMINLAIVLDHRSDLRGALDLLKRAVSLAPEDARAREQLGHVYLEQNEFQQAQEQLEKAVSLSPSDARLHYLLGQVYRREGLVETANKEFAISASLNGTHSTPDYIK